MEPLTFLPCLLLAPLILINLMFLAELAVGLRRGNSPFRPGGLLRTTIVIPAHNESEVIGATVEDLKHAAGANLSILVVADNCSDDTALVVRKSGVTVIERTDLQRRGKGYALDFAREWLRSNPPEHVIVLDADCRSDSVSLRNLASACRQSGQPSQAVNLISPSLTAPPMVQISTFAFLLKNLVRQRGLQRLTGGVHLTGTGMCLPWSHFNQADLATSSIVEDMRLGLEMSRRGAKPQLVEDSFVWSPHADIRETLTQRSRWEGGFLALAFRAAPEIMVTSFKGLRLRLFLQGVDLLIPPLALLAILNAAALLLTALAAAVGWSTWAPVALLVVLQMLVAAALVFVWWREGRQYMSTGALLKLPLYAAWKIPMYLWLATKGAPKQWRRTARLSGEGPEA